MNTATKKRGRRRNPYHCQWNDTYVDGLLQIKGTNRWRIVEGEQTGKEFRENEPHEAVRRFYELTTGKRPTVAIPVTPPKAATITTAPIATQGTWLPPNVTPAALAMDNVSPRIVFDENGEVSFVRDIDRQGFFVAMRKLILGQPQLCALETGIEWLQWHDHQQPQASPKLIAVIEHYATKPGLSHDESVRARKQWKEFCRVVGASTLKDITHAAVVKYETKMAGENLSPKSVKHRYSKIKTIVAYAMKRGMDSKECRAALDILTMLEVPNATPLAPHPIAVDHFWAVHATAVKAGDAAFAAMMLTAANCCMYSGEVSALKWSEVNLKTGEVVTARPKTGVARVAILWPETIAALKSLPRERDYVFFSCRRSYTTNLVSRHWAVYRDATKLADETTLPTSIKFGDIRDASYTYACRNVSLDKAKILAGHRLSGSTDHYVQRNPGFVKDACEAIRREFYPAK